MTSETLETIRYLTGRIDPTPQPQTSPPSNRRLGLKKVRWVQTFSHTRPVRYSDTGTGRAKSPGRVAMETSLTPFELARQTQLVADVLTLSRAVIDGKVDEAGRRLGLAIDNFPEIESGLLNSVAQGLLLLAETLPEDEAVRARSLASAALARVSAMMRGQ